MYAIRSYYDFIGFVVDDAEQLNDEQVFHADVSGETLGLTTLGQLAVNDAVNLEKALTLATRLGGHLVSGHVDEIGLISGISKGGNETAKFTIRIDPKHNTLIVDKGSVAVNGISLTISGTGRDWFTVDMIPHSLKETTMGAKRVV